MGDLSQDTIPIKSAIQGDQEVVKTPFGPISVTVAGDRNRTPLVTYHDVGVNHQSCFQQLMSCSSHKSLLVHNFCFYHIDAPGCEPGGECCPPGGRALEAENLVDQVSAVIRHFELRDVVCFGVGMGGYILASYAARFPKDVAGLILASPLCKRPGWWEWAFGKKTAYHLWVSGWVASAAKHLSHRLFGRCLHSANGGAGGDLVLCYKRETIYGISPLAVSLYLTSTLNRRDISELVPKIRCKTLLFSGFESSFEDDNLHFSSLLKPGIGSWVEIEGAGVLVTEEKPQALLQSIQLFLQGLQQMGHGLTWELDYNGAT
uniref:Uncharacterized protein n=1 Tax=Tetraselmis sp. GSL018 TaxID=582737 RepID=A0A061S533_9CHLO|mmetsp:Transcript_1708/g.4002  ORF Transcript_1708/g.4002 Transcript_1708/m.4002 type:complete len:318 (-) Transcript_1708:68-1021(-)|eukprot:CAMPEP_0177604992 /NCGR_PEP_ID=MMETSP0419_2-20121207/16440_1 /TAXON_ID=582737 /ORGANISM="Tetraselmis sp., Strain GSL018" /LENGTH=317 /DNA_ID=CAMNT_0019099065 /DNA_START=79 /DNA_END=1032 /DNA_ORIENTATION=-